MTAVDPGGLLTVGVLLSVVAAVALSTQSLCIRYGTVTNDSAQALVVVLCVNVAVLLPATLLFAQPLRGLTVTSLLAFSAAGFLGTMAGRALYYEGIKRIGASRSDPIRATQPLHAALVAVVVIGETVTASHVTSMVCIVAGVAVISYEHGRSTGGDSTGGLAAFALPLTAAFLYGIEPTFAKLGFAEGASTLTGLAIKTGSASVGYLLYLAWRDELPRVNAFERAEFPWLVAAGVCNTVFLLGYYAALTLEPVSVVVPLVQSSPLLVIVASALFVSDDLERITWRLVAGGLIVVVGAVGVTLSS